MSDLFHDGTSTVTQAAHRPWYRRRASQVAIAGTLAAGLTVVGLSLGTAANAGVEPADAVAEAAENLRELPTGVTITGGEDMAGSFTMIRTEDGVQVTLDAPDQGTNVGMALVGDRLFLRVAGGPFDTLANNPMALGATVAFPSLSALLQGQWVSLDVSEDSELLAAMQDLGAGQLSDPAAFEEAAAELQATLQSVGEDARGTLQTALQDNVTVTEPEQPVAGPAGSTHYQVVIDKQAIASELEPVLLQALEDVLTAVDAFVAEVGDQLPDGGAMWSQARAEILAKVDAAIAEREALEPGTVDVWIADGEFAQVQVSGATLTFDPDASIDAPGMAVSMDQDLLALLPLIEQYAPLLEQNGLPSLPLG
jgi:hypothetical protein